MKLVYIEWLDSYGCSSSWSELSSCNPATLTCKSVGWLLHDSEEYKVIVPHVSEEGHENAFQQGCGDMTIPTVAIQRIIPLIISENGE